MNLGTVLFIIIAGAALCLGVFIYNDPARMIEAQKRFYALINWHMEPISMEKEIRNTRWMGLFLIAFTVGAAILYGVQR